MTSPVPVNHADPEICRQCRGLCCQGHPGVWTEPQRFLRIFNLPKPASPQALGRALPGELVLREIDGVAIPAPQQQPSGCTFLDVDGCRLPEDQRPEQCLALAPALDTLIDGEIRCQLQPEGSTLTALQNWQRFWAHS
jgi:hypothetical protein